MTWYWLALLLLVVFLSAFLACAGYRSVRPIIKAKRYGEAEIRKHDGAQFPECFHAFEKEWNPQSFTLDVGDARLYGQYAVHPEGKHKVVILCHGHMVNRLAEVKYAPIFYRAGWSVLLYDHRYFGRSTGSICTLGQKESEDLRKVMAFARSVFGEDCIIGLHGESMGAATSLYVLDRESPAFVVADCPFADTAELMRYMLPHRVHIPAFPLVGAAALMGRLLYGYRMYAVSPRRSVAVSQVPICLFHGLEDHYIPHRHSEELFALCRSPKSELHLIPKAHHTGSRAADPVKYEEITRAFIESCTGKETD